MAPKKNGQSKTEKKNYKSELVEPQTQLDPNSRELYLEQIKDLEYRLERYQLKCDQQEILLSTFETQYDYLLNEKKDIVIFLKKELELKTDELIELNNSLVSIEELQISNKKTYEIELKKIKQEADDRYEKLQSENIILSQALRDLERFSNEKNKINEYISDLQKTIDDTRKKHDDEIYLIEKENLIEKDKRRIDEFNKIVDLKKKFNNEFYERMSQSTRMTINENIRLNKNMDRLTKFNDSLNRKYEELKKKELEDKLKIETLESINDSLLKDNAALKQALEHLLKKLDNNISGQSK